MEYFFTYTLKLGRSIQCIGKGHCFSKNGDALEAYLNRRPKYKTFDWDNLEFDWHASESMSLTVEQAKINVYVAYYGVRPPYNSRQGGGGRQIYVKCKAYKRDNSPCTRNALTGNYGYCGNHR